MKQTLFAVLTIFLASLAIADDEDRARAAGVVQAIGTFADFGEFQAICQLYDIEATSDYSSLWGNEPMTGDPTLKANGWSGFIPGFDTTRHDIDVRAVEVRDGTATVRAHVTADHWLDGNRWSISGFYDVQLAKRSGDWRITHWVFSLEREEGDRSLVDVAERRAVDRVERPIVCN